MSPRSRRRSVRNTLATSLAALSPNLASAQSRRLPASSCSGSHPGVDLGRLKGGGRGERKRSGLLGVHGRCPSGDIEQSSSPLWRSWFVSSPPSCSAGLKARERPPRRRWSMAQRPSGPSLISPPPRLRFESSRLAERASVDGFPGGPGDLPAAARLSRIHAGRRNLTTRPQAGRTVPTQRARARPLPPRPKRCCRK